MNEDIKARAALNAIGNGAIGGSFGNAGTTTGIQGSIGMDTGMDATNSMGRMSAEDSGSSPYTERYEESHDFTAANSNQTNVNVDALGRINAGSISDSGRTNETGSLASINSNDFRY